MSYTFPLSPITSLWRLYVSFFLLTSSLFSHFRDTSPLLTPLLYIYIYEPRFSLAFLSPSLSHYLFYIFSSFTSAQTRGTRVAMYTLILFPHSQMQFNMQCVISWPTFLADICTSFPVSHTPSNTLPIPPSSPMSSVACPPPSLQLSVIISIQPFPSLFSSSSHLPSPFSCGLLSIGLVRGISIALIRCPVFMWPFRATCRWLCVIPFLPILSSNTYSSIRPTPNGHDSWVPRWWSIARQTRIDELMSGSEKGGLNWPRGMTFPSVKATCQQPRQ